MSPKVLLVNDLEDYLDDFERVAREVGFAEFCRAEGVAEALHLIESNQFDVAVIDLNLDVSKPDTAEGLDVIRRLRELQPSCLIMAYTAHFDKQGVEYGIKAFGADADDFICEQWFGINHEQLLMLKLKIWYGSLMRGRGAGKELALSSM